MTVDTAWSDFAQLSVQVGTGDTHTPTTTGQWGISKWGNAAAKWAGVEPLWHDVTCEIQRLSIRRGVDYSTSRYPTSTMQLTGSNLDGWATDPGAAGYLPVSPGRAVRILGAATGYPTVAQWTGTIDDVLPGYDAQSQPDVRIDAVDGLATLAAVDGLEIAPVGDGELSGARIARILDRVGWPKAWRQIAAGQVTMQGTNFARNLADEAGVTADSEGGAFFADRGGYLTFKDRDWLRTGAPAVWTIGNVPGAHVCPVGWEITHAMEDVTSIVALSNAGGTVHQYTDSTALSLYGPSTYRRYDLICSDEAQLDLLGARLLAVRARAGPRIRAVTLSLMGDHRLAALLGTIDYGQRIRAVHVDADGVTAFDQTMILTQVAHDVTPYEWTVRLGLESAAPYSPSKPWGAAYWAIDRWSTAA